MTKQQKHTAAAETNKRLNGRHSVVIRMGAMEDSITLDGHKTDMSRRDGEDFKDWLGRRQRATNDLVQMVFSPRAAT